MKLQLFRPLKQLQISQNFTENNACVKLDGTGKVIPRKEANCPIGYESVYEHVGLKGHNGLDLPAIDWEPVFASLEGIVTELQTERERGLGIGIVSEQKYEWSDAFSNANGDNQIKLRYWHLAGMNVKMGQKVKIGDVIGWADNTGWSTGTHLHWECKPIEGKINVLQNNGMFGAIDPLVYLQDISAFEKTDFLAKIQLQIWQLSDWITNLLNKGR
mgnify:CR=1 FL=1